MVSVITVTLNAESPLAATIASLLTRDRDAFEWLVVDGGSTDGTIARCRDSGLEPRLLPYPGSSIYEAMNRGIDEARGDLVYFLNAGDALSPGFDFAEVLDYKREHPETVLLYGDVLRLKSQSIYAGRFTRAKLLWKNICHQSIFFDTEAIRARRYSIKYRANADYALNIELLGQYPARCVYLPLTVAEYDDRDKSISRSGYENAFERDRLTLIHRHMGKRYALLELVRRATHVRGMLRKAGLMPPFEG